MFSYKQIKSKAAGESCLPANGHAKRGRDITFISRGHAEAATTQKMTTLEGYTKQPIDLTMLRKSNPNDERKPSAYNGTTPSACFCAHLARPRVQLKLFLLMPQEADHKITSPLSFATHLGNPQRSDMTPLGIFSHTRWKIRAHKHFPNANISSSLRTPDPATFHIKVSPLTLEGQPD